MKIKSMTISVEVEVTFEVDIEVPEDEEDEASAREIAFAAADATLYHHVALLDAAERQIEEARVHVDGHGWTTVRIKT